MVEDFVLEKGQQQDPALPAGMQHTSRGATRIGPGPEARGEVMPRGELQAGWAALHKQEAEKNNQRPGAGKRLEQLGEQADGEKQLGIG